MEPFADRDIADLEREVHRALHDLPPVRAPYSLAPRVMAAVRADGTIGRWVDGAMPGSWRTWPLHWQLLSFVCACSLLLAIAVGVPYAQNWIGGLTATRAMTALWDMFVAPIAMPILVWTAVMCTACALIVAALKHVAWEGREISH